MKYNQSKHITHEMLADAAGMGPQLLKRNITHGNCPEPVGKTPNRSNRMVSFYDRSEALLWAQQVNPKPEVNLVPSATPRPLHQQGTYRPSAQMSINQQRAAELYPHRLYTPKGIGNGVDYGQSNRRFST